MAIKTYRVKDLHEAFVMIQADLGKNAVLVETREIRKRRLFGILPSRVMLEVIATDEAEEEQEKVENRKQTENIEEFSPISQDFEKKASVVINSKDSENCATTQELTRESKTVSEGKRLPQESLSPDFWSAIPNQETPEENEPLNVWDFMTFHGAELEMERKSPQVTVSGMMPSVGTENHSEKNSTTLGSGFRKRQFFSETESTGSEKNRSFTPQNHFPQNENLANINTNLLFGCGNGFFDQIANMSQSGPTGISAEFRDALLQIYAKLQTVDMNESSIKELMTRLREDTLLYAATGKRKLNTSLEFLEQKLQELVAQEIQTSGPIPISRGKRHTVALVGPTGVGKTTTIAKLAIDYRQRKNCQVGLITLDLSRMGAVEQLQTFADVIGIPMLCVSTRSQMRDAMSRMADFDLVLIDTAGQSRAGEMSLQEMRILLDVANVEDVMLVLSSTTRTRILQQTVDAFSCLGITSLILTKLDESLGLGNLFPLLQTATMPVSYLTNGQKVPDDFETADRMRLARYILGDEQTVAR